MEEMIDGNFIFLPSWLDCVPLLTKEEYTEYMRSIIGFGCYGTRNEEASDKLKAYLEIVYRQITEERTRRKLYNDVQKAKQDKRWGKITQEEYNAIKLRYDNLRVSF